ncbi:unnamed protein product, partial [Nesidiocoris tenuis]
MDDCVSDGGSSGLGGDPLARLSDLGSCSSWSASPEPPEEGTPEPEDRTSTRTSTATDDESPIGWQQRCLALQLEFQKYKLQSSKAKDALREK